MSKKNLKQGVKLGTGLSIVSLIIPIVGLFIFFKEKDLNPIKAKLALNLAIVGIVIGVVLQALITYLSA